MKKFILAFLLTLNYGLCDANPTVIELVPMTNTPPDWSHGQTRVPICIPLFYIEENILSFNPYDDDFVIELWDGDVLVYNQTVFEGTHQVELPNSLEGEYSLVIKFENRAYIGNVEL